MITALALDPGRTTGYALALKDEENYFVAYDQAEMNHGELWRFIPPTVDFVICEKFDYRHMKDGADLYPCELIGVVKLWVEGPTFRDDDLVWLHMQEPSIQSEKKAYFSNAKLKSMNLYKASPEHGRSALKHLLHFFAFGPGYKYHVEGQAPELVEESWLREKAGIPAHVNA